MSRTSKLACLRTGFPIYPRDSQLRCWSNEVIPTGGKGPPPPPPRRHTDPCPLNAFFFLRDTHGGKHPPPGPKTRTHLAVERLGRLSTSLQETPERSHHAPQDWLTLLTHFDSINLDGVHVETVIISTVLILTWTSR